MALGDGTQKLLVAGARRTGEVPGDTVTVRLEERLS
jgi:hypothetical protein